MRSRQSAPSPRAPNPTRPTMLGGSCPTTRVDLSQTSTTPLMLLGPTSSCLALMPTMMLALLSSSGSRPTWPPSTGLRPLGFSSWLTLLGTLLTLPTRVRVSQ
uniref:Uncharacterized protein n=1 Tax=Opuntia streptacantha TaxID=393608 RepID=A0A7C9E7Y9_OPUST